MLNTHILNVKNFGHSTLNLFVGQQRSTESPISWSKNTNYFSEAFPMSPKSSRTLIWIKASHTGRRSNFPRKTDG